MAGARVTGTRFGSALKVANGSLKEMPENEHWKHWKVSNMSRWREYARKLLHAGLAVVSSPT